MSALRNALRDLPGPVFADLLESEAAYLVIVDLPGVSEDTIDVTITGPRLRIEARREKEFPQEYRYRREDRPLFLDAELLVPTDASGEGASATIDRGTLELRLPKRDHDDSTAVPITVENGEDASIEADATDRHDDTSHDDTSHDDDATTTETDVIGTDAIDTIEDDDTTKDAEDTPSEETAGDESADVEDAGGHIVTGDDSSNMDET